MNRFLVDKKLILYFGIENFIKFINSLTITFTASHVIIKDDESGSFTNEITKTSGYDKKMRLYNRVLTLTKGIEPTTLDYIEDIGEDHDQFCLDLLYTCKIDGFSGMRMKANSIFKLIMKDDNIYIIDPKGEEVGNSLEGINADMYTEDSIGLNGLCQKCLNPLCSMYNKDGSFISNMANTNMCIRNTDILNRVSKEAKEVEKHQFIYLMEV
ncbi:MAG: hypothetical protein ACRCTZ_23175, partial [Sarcina sp.]